MVILENKKLHVEIGRGRGARIENFKDKLANKDWVYRPQVTLVEEELPLSFDKPFYSNWISGWGEIFPNEQQTDFLGFKLPDHGEAWRKHWFEEDRGERFVRFSISCESYPILLRKTFSIDEELPKLKIDYEVVSLSDQTLPYIFQFYCPIACSPNDKISLPESVINPIEEIKVNDGYWYKIVDLTQLSKGSCGIYNQETETSLKFEFPTNLLNHIWLYRSVGGLMNDYFVSLGPSNTGHKYLTIASHENSCGVAKPWQKISFSMIISILTYES